MTKETVYINQSGWIASTNPFLRKEILNLSLDQCLTFMSQTLHLNVEKIVYYIKNELKNSHFYLFYYTYSMSPRIYGQGNNCIILKYFNPIKFRPINFCIKVDKTCKSSFYEWKCESEISRAEKELSSFTESIEQLVALREQDRKEKEQLVALREQDRKEKEQLVALREQARKEKEQLVALREQLRKEKEDFVMKQDNLRNREALLETSIKLANKLKH